jgi:hypothetical protein
VADLKETMPVITLWQPWASLIFVGVKLHETRSFKYPPRLEGQQIVIHSAKIRTADKHISPDLNILCQRVFGQDWGCCLPRGRVLGVVRLAGCFSVEDIVEHQSSDNLISGDWSNGRYAWKLEDVFKLGEAFEFRGKQGWGCIPVLDIERAMMIS